MKALLLDVPLKTAHVTSLPTPTTAPPSHLLLHTSHIGLNPVDALYTFHPLAPPSSPPRIIGSDFSATVLSGPLPRGTLVAGFLQGAASSNPLPGAFAEYITAESDLVWRVPEGVSPAQAAGVSLCGLTAAQMVFWRLGVPAPFGYVPRGENKERLPGTWDGSREVVTVFVYGASTSVGMYAAQLVRKGFEAAGVRVRLVGAASKARWGLLKGGTYGYDELVDYREEGWVENVRGWTEGGGGWILRWIACRRGRR
ncbi:chaperonin 10-like protein [Schizothecium vesticola]|uniref:Chaperonin 10-like protein n=1 Tax=Schizothecium vesticola TaxID=314040 RepID=A0AA40EIL0_9PEZI|nr:chaperonin 10-like protein [Schizothecium vesticola]